MAEPISPKYAELLNPLFAAEEQKLRASLGEIRASLVHGGDKGSNVEEVVRSLLRRYLPLSMRVGQGEVIDHTGQRSKQTDVVIVGEDHPFTFEEAKPSLFFIEGVMGAGEAKSVLTPQDLDKAIADSKLFKGLQMWFNEEDTARANPSDFKRFLGRPPWFLLAFESQMSLETIRERLVAESGGDTVGTNLIDGILHSTEVGYSISVTERAGSR